MNFSIFLMTAFCVLFSEHCTKNSRISLEGRAVYKERFIDNHTKVSRDNPIYPDANIWFRDGFAIQEELLTKILTDENGNEEYENSVERYVFIDLKTNYAYEYLNFSDTAKMVHKYKRENPNNINSNLFFGENLFTGDNLVELPDTSINGITYKRVSIRKSFVPNDPEDDKYNGMQLEFMATGYLRCDMKKYFFLSFEPLFGKKRGCPVMRIDRVHLTADLPTSTQEVEIISTQLTLLERKVFDAWEKNAKTLRK